MRRRFSFSAFPLTAISLTATAAAVIACPASARAETLADALTIAYETNPTIRAERARQRATEEATRQAWAAALPQISASGAYSRVDQTQQVNSAIFGGASEQSFDLNTTTAGVTGEQPIFNGLRNINTIRQARARVRAGGAQLVSVEQQVLLRAATAYFDLLRDTAVFEANLNNVKVLLRQKEEAALRFEVGEITRTDVAQAEARLAGARAQLTAAQAALAISRATYQEVIGSAPGTLEASTPSPEIPETEEQAQALAALYASAVIGAKAQEQASRRQIAIEKGAFGPTVSLTASYQYAEEPSSFVLNDEQFAYGARATIPLFQGGLRLSRVREARALNDRDRMRLIEAERNVRAQVSSAWEQYRAALDRITSARAQIDANELALRGVRRESQLGARTTLDVLNAEQELLNATVALAEAERDENVATYNVLAAMGLLTLGAATGEEGVPEAGDGDAFDFAGEADGSTLMEGDAGADVDAERSGVEIIQETDLFNEDDSAARNAGMSEDAAAFVVAEAAARPNVETAPAPEAPDVPTPPASASPTAAPTAAEPAMKLADAAQPPLRDGTAPVGRRPVNAPPATAAPDAAPASAAADQPEIQTASVLFGVHLASYRSPGAAHAGWRTLEAEFPDALGGLGPRIARVNVAGQGEFMRLIAGPFSTEGEALGVCRRLEAAGQYCVVRNFDGEPLVMIDQ